MPIGKLHRLKIKTEHYQAVIAGKKNFEIRKNDRSFTVGDSILLLEWSEKAGYTGKEVMRMITYILSKPIYGLKQGYCILSFQPPLETMTSYQGLNQSKQQ